MFHLVLYQPEIPPNTGNIIRLCANTGARLHLIEPLGFSLDNRELKRAGLDYHECTEIQIHANVDVFLKTVKPPRMLAFTTRARRHYTDARYQKNDALLFGPETRGLPQALLDALPHEHRLRLPLKPGNRSLNLSNAAAIVVYEAWHQLGFAGGE
jgi:tRNA (cytidine/uridine-2'-O-)-methyltransferase